MARIERPAVRRLGDAGRGDGRQPGALEVEQDLVLAPAGLERQLLEGVQDPSAVRNRTRCRDGPDRQLPEGERRGRPVGERRLPGQVDEGDRRVAEVEARKGRHRWAGESIAAVRSGAPIPERRGVSASSEPLPEIGRDRRVVAQLLVQVPGIGR